MADSKLSALTEVTSLADSDEQYINDGGVSKRITSTNLGISLLANAGVTASVAELNYSDGVTSNIQVQLDNKVSDNNIIINGDFRVNQKPYISTAPLGSGSYGHDRWKAGSTGGDYSFTQLASSTVITIASGKSLIQVVEDKNVSGGTYTVSWTGTAQARGGVDSDTPSGAYAASPITLSSQTAGTVMSVEFNDGTLSNIQVDNLANVTTFTPRPYGEELALCQRYYYKWVSLDNFTPVNTAFAISSSAAIVTVPFPVEMRAQPVFTKTSIAHFRVLGGTLGAASGDMVEYSSVNQQNGAIILGGTWTASSSLLLTATNTAAGMFFSAEL